MGSFIQFRIRGVPAVFVLIIAFLMQGSIQIPTVEKTGGTRLSLETHAEEAARAGARFRVPLPPETVLTIDDFESGGSGWKASRDEASSTIITCEAEQGTGTNASTSLRIDFSIAPGSWATCARWFDTPQDWSAGEWLAYDVHAEKSGQPFSVIVYGGTADARQTYIQQKDTPVEYPEGYVPFTSMWKELLRANGEEAAGEPLEDPGHAAGVAFGFKAGADEYYRGSLWIDNITLKKSPTYPEAGNPLKFRLPCASYLLFPLAGVGATLVLRRKKNRKNVL
jgi:hypothetical protein